MASTTADRHDPWPIGGRDDRADPVAAEDGELGHGRGDVDGQIGLPPADRPEVEAAGPVEQDRDVEVALLDRVPDVRFAGPGKDRPVHPADVVARLVGSRLSGLDTVAEHQRGMTAVPAAEDPVADRELDAAEPCRQVETGTPARRSSRGRFDCPAGRSVASFPAPDWRCADVHAAVSAMAPPRVGRAACAGWWPRGRAGSGDRREQLDEDVVDREPLGQMPGRTARGAR